MQDFERLCPMAARRSFENMLALHERIKAPCMSRGARRLLIPYGKV